MAVARGDPLHGPSRRVGTRPRRRGRRASPGPHPGAHRRPDPEAVLPDRRRPVDARGDARAHGTARAAGTHPGGRESRPPAARARAAARPARAQRARAAVEPGHGTGNPLRPVPPRAALPRRDGRRPAARPLRPRRGPLPRAPRARDRRRPAPAEADRPPRHRRAARGDRPRLGPAGPRALGRRDDASVARARVRRKARRGHGGGDDAGRWPLELVRHVLSPGRDVRAARTPPSARRRRASPRRRPQPFRAPAVELLARLPRARPTPPPRRPRRRRRLERLGDARGDRAEPRRAQRGAAVAPPPDAERGGRVADGAPRGGALVYCRVIACDFDGTGAANGRLAPETASVLASARALGFVTLLVTGRVLEDL